MATPKARFGGIDVISKDTSAALAFYRELGVAIPEDKVFRTGDVAHHVDLQFPGELGFDIDSAALTAAYDPKWSGSGVVVSFRTDTREDVDALHDHMVGLGHPSHLAPFDAFWGARFAVLVDPDANLVSLISPMDSAMCGAPPSF